MDKDYGLRKKRKRSGQEIMALCVGLAACLAIAAAVFAGGWSQRMARVASEAPYWTVNGPPCQALRSFPVSAPAPSVAFNYGDGVFGRAFGHADCALIPDKWTFGLSGATVCQFTSPYVLKVTADKGEFDFLTGAGQPATVTVRNGTASCVRNANFR